MPTMNRIGIVLLLLASVGVGICEKKDEEYRTGGHQNGRAWKGLDTTGRMEYLCGIEDGGYMAAIKSASKIPQLLPRLGTYAETISALDDFYADALNARIRVVDALSYVKLKSDGASEGTLKAYEARLRKGTQAQALQ